MQGWKNSPVIVVLSVWRAASLSQEQEGSTLCVVSAPPISRSRGILAPPRVFDLTNISQGKLPASISEQQHLPLDATASGLDS